MEAKVGTGQDKCAVDSKGRAGCSRIDPQIRATVAGAGGTLSLRFAVFSPLTATRASQFQVQGHSEPRDAHDSHRSSHS